MEGITRALVGLLATVIAMLRATLVGAFSYLSNQIGRLDTKIDTQFGRD
jgi:hypothetical protein